MAIPNNRSNAISSANAVVTAKKQDCQDYINNNVNDYVPDFPSTIPDDEGHLYHVLIVERREVNADLDDIATTRTQTYNYNEWASNKADLDSAGVEYYIFHIPCVPPINFQLSDIASDKATISWDAGGTETKWDLIWGLRGFDYTDATKQIGTEVGNTAGTKTISSLSKGVDYDLWIRSACATPSAYIRVPFQTLSCVIISSLSVSNQSYHTADVGWTAGGDETQWDLVWGLESFDVDNQADWIGATTVNANSHTITGLDQDEDYDVYVRSNCGVQKTAWAKANFQTILCDPVTALAASEEDDSSAKITWTAGGTETGWDLIWGLKDFDMNKPSEVIGTTSETSNEFVIDELEKSEDYDVYVRADCGTGISEWEKLNFQTTA